MHWANAGETATELRVKNAPWFLLGSGVRIVHVLSVAILLMAVRIKCSAQMPGIEKRKIDLIV